MDNAKLKFFTAYFFMGAILFVSFQNCGGDRSPDSDTSSLTFSLPAFTPSEHLANTKVYALEDNGDSCELNIEITGDYIELFKGYCDHETGSSMLNQIQEEVAIEISENEIQMGPDERWLMFDNLRFLLIN